MTVISKLATTLNRRDEVPNQELAREIAAKEDKAAITELIALLKHKNKNIQHDSIKVLYEVGEIKPGLVSSYANEFLALLVSKNNRMQWGGMTALNSITLHDPALIY